MSTKLQDMLAQRPWILADGATGTNLFNLGLEAGEAPELWNLEAPDNIRALYFGSVDAGSDLILTNSFGGNASRLRLHGLENRVHEINKIAAQLAVEVVKASGRDVVVAGSMGPTGEIMGEAGSLSHEDAADMFEVQARGLIDGGADVLWVETISAPEEFAAAADAIGRTGAPWCGTMSFDSAGRTMMGLTSKDMVSFVAGLDHQPIAFGANCGVGASDLIRTVQGMSRTGTDATLIAKGNAGIPKYLDGHIHYDGTPELMAQYATMARNSGARIIGGCCGTMPEHLTAMKAALQDEPKADPPSFEDVQAVLGGFSSESDGTEAEAVGRVRERRGRRRRD